MSRNKTLPAAGFRIAALALVGLSLSACIADRPVSTGSIYPRDYRVRHPIVLTDEARNLDVFATGGAGLDDRQYDDVKAFAAEYREYGRGPILVQVPGGTRHDVGANRSLDAIRRALAEGGLPGRSLSVSTYAPADPTLAAPIRLSFQRLDAKVASKCGLWPQDLGITDYGFNLRNEQYWNYGCATQTNVAAQIADPIDLVRGRTEGGIDPIRRGQNIDKLRKGNDPSTNYRQDGQNQINQQVAN